MEKEINNIIDISKQLELFQKLHNERERAYRTVFIRKDYAGALKNSTEIYPDSAHFIYELIQNADDAYATKIDIILDKAYLIFKHNGTEHFNVTDVDNEDIKPGHINSITAYRTTKEDEKNKIGKFGVGFKSVYQYTKTPVIYDDFFKFKIKNRMIPILIEKDHEFRQKGETLFYIPFKESEYESSYNDISNKLKTLINATLFLNNLNSIFWQDNHSNEKQLFTKTIKNSYTSNDILCEKLELDDSNKKSNVLMFSRNVQIENNGNHKVCVGYFINDRNHIITDTKQNVYCFFPTSESFGSCFISHAPFELTNNRTTIFDYGKTNKLLVDELGKLVADSLIELKYQKILNSNIFDIVGEGNNCSSSDYKKYINPENIYIPCLNKIKQENLLLSKSEEYISPDKLYSYQSISLTDLISKEQLNHLENRKGVDFLHRTINDKRKNSRLIKDLNIGFFDYERFAKDITSSFMDIQPDTWIKSFFGLILDDARSYWKKEYSNPVFLRAPIIKLITNEWCAPCNSNMELNIYYNAPGVDGYNIVNPRFVRCDKVKEFLDDIGCKQPDQYDFIKAKIIPKYNTENDIKEETICSDFNIIYKYSKTIKDDYTKYCDFLKLVSNTKIFPYIKEELISSSENNSLASSYSFEKIQYVCRTIATDIYLDSEILNEYFLGYTKKAHILFSEVFKDIIDEIGKEKFDEFMKELNVMTKPKIIQPEYNKKYPYNSIPDEIKEKLKGIYNKSYTSVEINDRDIDGLENALIEPSKELSLLIWKWLIEYEPNSFNSAMFYFRYYRSTNVVQCTSTIVNRLKENKWLYNKKEELCSPQEITKEELIDSGYLFPDYKLCEIIGIKVKAKEIDWAAAGATEKDKRAHAIGKKVIDSGLSEEEIEELLRRGKEEKNKKLQKEGQKTHNVSNPEYTSRKESEKYDSSIFGDNKYNSTYSSSTKQQNQIIADNTEKEISALREKLEKENEKKIKTQELRDSVDTLQKYSKEWFDTLLQLEYGEEAINENISERAISLSFSKVEKEKNSDRVFVLKYPSKSYIPLSIEDIGGLEVKFSFTNKEDFSKSFEVASVKDFTLRLKAKQADLEFLNGIDWTKCVNASININNPVQLMSKLITAFNELDLPANYNLKDNLKNNIRFVFGPPATGKSTFLSNEIKNLIDNNSKCKILVLCPTNKACDVLTQKIMDIEEEPAWLGRFVATGSEKIENEGFVCDRDSNIYLQDKCCLISTIARLPYDGFKPDIGLRNIDWDYIIIDEASMIPLVQIVYAIYNFSPKSKIIIAGDPLQISPIVREEKWKNENIYKMVNLNSFDQPKTEPIQFNITNLKKQYRSISSIGHLFSKYAYNDLLEHDRTDATQMPLSLSNINIKPINLIAFRVSKYSDIFRPYKLSGSNIHLYSVLFVTELFKFISNEYVKNNSDKTIKIGIICPYVAEAQMIEKLVEQIPNIPNNIEITVGTIHGFQGDECDIIFVVFNPSVGLKKSPDKIFINNKNIINVAISRARDYLFIFFPDKDTEGFENLVEIKKLGNIACEKPENVALFTADEIEKVIFEKKFYIENNVFVTTHQLANVYTQTAQKYEIRIDENSVDIQIDSNIEK